LGDSAENPRFVETLPRRGYRFIAQVNGLQRDARSPATTGESDQLEASKRPSSAWQPLCYAWRGIAVAFAIAAFAWESDAVGRSWRVASFDSFRCRAPSGGTFSTTPNRNFLPME